MSFVWATEQSAEAVADQLGYNVGLLRRRMQPFESPSFALQDLPVLTKIFGSELLAAIVRDCGGVLGKLQQESVRLDLLMAQIEERKQGASK